MLDSRGIREKLELLTRERFELIVSSELVTDLLRVYSYLYNDGKQVNWCERCLRNYHELLIKNGMTKLELIEKVRTRKCKPAFNGLRYVHKFGDFINSEMLTDEQALKHLKNGILKESDFVVLPENDTELVVISDDEIKEEVIELVQETKKEVKKKPSK